MRNMEKQRTAGKATRGRFTDYVAAHRVELILLAVYALVSAALALVHEPWRDEAQAWLFARDQSVPQMLGNLHTEGHPALWFLMLWPLAHLGLPYGSEFVLHWALAMAGGALLMLRSPFDIRVKALLLFSYLIGFVYNIVARNYVLLEVALFAIAAIFPLRYGKRCVLYGVLLAVLINAHVYGALAAAAFLAYDAIYLFSHDAAGRRHWRSRAMPIAAVLLVAAAGFALLLMTMSGPRYASVTDPTLGALLTSDVVEMAKKVLSYSFGSDNTGVMENLYKLSDRVPLFIAMLRFFDVNILPMLALIVLLGRFKPALLSTLFLVPFCALLVFSTNVAYRHVALFALVVIVGYWVAQTTPGEYPVASAHWDGVVKQIRVGRVSVLRLAIAWVLLCSSGAYVLMAGIEATAQYSNGRNLALFLQREGYDTPGTVVVTINPEQFSSALPYLQHIEKDEVPGLGGDVSYLLWDQNYYDWEPAQNNPFEYARWRMEQGNTKVVVILSGKSFQKPEDFDCIYDTRDVPTVKNEQFAVFVPNQ